MRYYIRIINGKEAWVSRVGNDRYETYDARQKAWVADGSAIEAVSGSATYKEVSEAEANSVIAKYAK